MQIPCCLDNTEVKKRVAKPLFILFVSVNKDFFCRNARVYLCLPFPPSFIVTPCIHPYLFYRTNSLKQYTIRRYTKCFIHRSLTGVACFVWHTFLGFFVEPVIGVTLVVQSFPVVTLEVIKTHIRNTILCSIFHSCTLICKYIWVLQQYHC